MKIICIYLSLHNNYWILYWETVVLVLMHVLIQLFFHLYGVSLFYLYSGRWNNIFHATIQISNATDTLIKDVFAEYCDKGADLFRS